jgi:hypothetical protein
VQVTGHARKLAIDLFRSGNRVNPLDGGSTGIPDGLSMVTPKPIDQRMHPEVRDVSQMRRRMPGVHGGQTVALHERHSSAGLLQKVSSRDAGDTPADHCDIDFHRFFELRKPREFYLAGPVRRLHRNLLAIVIECSGAPADMDERKAPPYAS